MNDLDLPQSAAIRAAYEWVRSIEPPVLLNHSVRAYIYGRAVGEAEGWQPGKTYDDEVLFLSCLLHDIGLTEQGNRDQRFEVDGADLAVQFLGDEGFPQNRADLVWESIALHSSPGIANRRRPEVALLHAGARVDIVGGPRDLPPGLGARTHAALPRLGIQNAFRDAIVAQVVRKPSKAMPHTLAAELLRQHMPAAGIPTWADLVARSGWDE